MECMKGGGLGGHFGRDKTQWWLNLTFGLQLSRCGTLCKEVSRMSTSEGPIKKESIHPLTSAGSTVDTSVNGFCIGITTKSERT